MKEIIKISLIISIFCNFIYSQTLEDRAFNEYKNRNYKEAVRLYKEAAKKNSLKAILMLGLFSEKGIAVPQNRDRAIKFYKYIIKKTSNLKDILRDNEEKKKLNITIAALNRLYILTHKPKYQDISNKIKELLNRSSQQREHEVLNALFDSQSNNSAEDDFLLLCPSANKVAIEDREGIGEFDCELFDNFPERMALFMKLRRIKFKLSESNRDTILLERVNRKISKIIKPIMKFLEQEAIECYKDAQTNADIKACDYDYLVKSDLLLFDNAAYKMEKEISKKSIPVEELDVFDKEKLINRLISDIKNGRYGKPYRSMVQY